MILIVCQYNLLPKNIKLWVLLVYIMNICSILAAVWWVAIEPAGMAGSMQIEKY